MGQHFIELNGKRYNALTGEFLGHASAPSKLRHIGASSPGRTIDGFIRPVKEAAHTPAPITAVATQTTPSAPLPPKPAPKFALQRAAPPLVRPHQPQHAKTLMRHTVKKPQANLKPTIKIQAPAELMAKPAGAIVPKQSASQIDPLRLARAHHAHKHYHVRRFAPNREPTHHVLAPQATLPQTRLAGAIPQGKNIDFVHQPVRQIQAQPAPVRPHQASSSQPADVFEAAIAHATSHQQPAPHIQRHTKYRQLFSTLAGIAAFLIIGGFIAYLNMPAIELHVASARAGFHAQMPGYRPTGYALGPIQSEKGKINLNFHSGDSNFFITQQTSDWNSQTLLDNYVALNSKRHQTVQNNGRTIYLFGNNATWVSGGVRYDITYNANLTTDEIISLANSM